MKLIHRVEAAEEQIIRRAMFHCISKLNLNGGCIPKLLETYPLYKAGLAERDTYDLFVVVSSD